MGTGYVRNDTANNIADGNVINASDLDGEFDAIQSAFHASTGHSHDGTTGEGPQLTTSGLADDAVTGAKIDSTTTITAASFVGPLTGNASTASTLATTRNIALSGDVSGNANFNGGSSITIETIVADDSHNHVVGNIDDFTEQVQDVVGGMVSTNTENGIAVTYDDVGGKLNFDVNDPLITLNGDVSGSATMTNLGNVTIVTTVADDSHNHTIGNVDNLQTTLDAKVPLAGGTMTGALNFGDSVKAQFGASNDLQIYHDGTNSYIADASGTGFINIRSNAVRLANADGSEILADFVQNGAVTLYYDNGVKLNTTTTGVDVTGGVSIDDDNNFSFGDGTTYIQGSGAADSLKFITNGSEAMRIDSSGNVGIGTTPAGWTAFDVLQMSNGVNIASYTGGTGQLHVGYNNYWDGTNYKYVVADEASRCIQRDGEHRWYTAPYGTAGSNITFSETMRIDSSGNLLVGTTDNTLYDNTTGGGIALTSSGRLDVNRSADLCAIFNRTGSSDGTSIQFRKDGTVVGSIDVATAGTTYNTTSDARLKTDIQSISDATEKLMSMNPVYHRWINDSRGHIVTGFIAQEMKEIVPEAVSGSPDSEEMMAMDYGRITPILVAALQDAHRKIEELESRLAAVEA